MVGISISSQLAAGCGLLEFAACYLLPAACS